MPDRNPPIEAIKYLIDQVTKLGLEAFKAWDTYDAIIEVLQYLGHKVFSETDGFGSGDDEEFAGLCVELYTVIQGPELMSSSPVGKGPLSDSIWRLTLSLLLSRFMKFIQSDDGVKWIVDHIKDLSDSIREQLK